ncbi:UNVERIFIED_CONTAM: hypothetical protein HDU68_004624, partial [Siphonaria sp. JEL0065]
VQYAGQASWLTTTTSFATAGEIIGVSAGSSRTLGSSQNVVVDATFYSDAFNIGSTGQYKCAWTCLNAHGFLCASSVTKLLTGCSSNVLTGQVIPGTYSLNVFVQDTLTGVSASSKYPAKLTIGSNGVPSVKITLPSQSTSSYSNKFALNAVVDATTVSSLANVKYSWSGCSDSTYSSLNFGNANTFLTDVSSAQVLKFSPGALLGDTTYCVAVTVADGTNTATAQITFQTYETPFGGFCFLQTASIKALNQPLQYSCPYWAVDTSAQPLAYQFYVRTAATNPWTLVVPSDRSSLMSSTFVTGQYQIKVVVSDEYGSTASGVASSFAAADNGLSANAQSLQCSTDVCVQLQQALITYNATQNSAGMAQAIGAAALNVNVTSPDFVTILQLLTEYSDNVYVDTAATGPFLASILQTIAGSSYTLKAAVVPQFFALVKSVIHQITENGKNEYPPNCVDRLAAESLFLVLDQTLGTQSSLGLTDAQQADAVSVFNEATDTLAKCFSRNQAAQEYPFTFTAGFLTREIGVSFTNSNATFCTFNVAPNGATTSSETISYSCGSKSSTEYPGTSIDGIRDLDLIVSDLTLHSGSDESNVQVSATELTLSVTNFFEKVYEISSNEYMCAFFNTTLKAWSTQGCVSHGVTDGKLSCTCNHLTDFTTAVVGKATYGGLSIGAIVGSVIGALALVLVTAGSIYHIRRQQQAEIAGAQGSLLPTTTPPPLAPVLDAPITQPTPLSQVVATTNLKPIPPPPATIPSAAIVGTAAAAAVAVAAVVAAAVIPKVSKCLKMESG